MLTYVLENWFAGAFGAMVGFVFFFVMCGVVQHFIGYEYSTWRHHKMFSAGAFVILVILGFCIGLFYLPAFEQAARERRETMQVAYEASLHHVMVDVTDVEPVVMTDSDSKTDSAVIILTDQFPGQKILLIQHTDSTAISVGDSLELWLDEWVVMKAVRWEGISPADIAREK